MKTDDCATLDGNWLEGAFYSADTESESSRWKVREKFDDYLSGSIHARIKDVKPSLDSIHAYAADARSWGAFLVSAPRASTEAVAQPQVNSDAAQLERDFGNLSKQWKRDTKLQSSVSAIVMHPAYLDIIGMGRAAVPFILRDLRKENSHWFTALRAITKAAPVNPADAGNLKRMRDAWLKWGKANGYLD